MWPIMDAAVLSRFGTQSDPPHPAGTPTYHYSMAVLDANLIAPFKLGSLPLRYVSTLHGQYTNDVLYYLDSMTLGGRYTVRGFDGEVMLAASSGFYWRNELQAPLGQTNQAIYLGLDYVWPG